MAIVFTIIQYMYITILLLFVNYGPIEDMTYMYIQQ